MLTDEGRKRAEEDVGEGVQQHDQNTRPEQPVTGGGVRKEDLWVLETQAGDREQGEVLGDGHCNSLPGGNKRRGDW